MRGFLLMQRRPPKLFAGERLRRLRADHGVGQAALARAVGVSPSYLSQIESDHRPLPRGLMQRLAGVLGVSLSAFEDSDALRLAHELREATTDPLFDDRPLTLDEAQTALQNAPALADRFLHLYRAFGTRAEQVEPLVSHPTARQAAVSAYDEVRDWVQDHHNYFDGLDRAAERLATRLAERDGFSRTGLGEALVRYLRDRHGMVVSDDPTLLEQGTVWKLNRNPPGLLLAADAATESRTFWMAHIVARQEQGEEVARVLNHAALSSAEAVALARVALANYFAGALMMPYARFHEEARLVRHDIARLQRRFGASFEQVCHRLSTLQRPELPGVPFFFLKTDIAGNVLKRTSATRFQFARFGGPCPLWNVYGAFARPGEILAQLARTPDEVAYLNIARTVGRSGSAYLSRPRSVAVVLGCEIAYAPLTVYAAGLDLSSPEAAVPIGPGCRACERTDCRHRAVPSAGHELDVGSSERGLVPYRIRR